MPTIRPRQGEVWLTAFDPIVGGEIAKTRPSLIISVDSINASPLAISIVAPITTTPQEAGVRIELPQAPGEPRRVSYALPYQIRTVSHNRLTRRIAVADAEVRREVARRIVLFTRVAVA